MAEYDNARWQRNLPFPLKDSEFPEYVEPALGTVTQPNIAIFNPDEPDEVIDIHFRMSMSQFTAIASAIDVGRDIAFGERSYELWRTWCKALIGEITVNCEDVADCVAGQLAIDPETNTPINIDFYNTVNTVINQNGYGDVNRINVYQTTIYDRVSQGTLEEEVAPPFECNLDRLWAGIRDGIVARLDDLARDLLEDLAAIPNAVERLAVFIDVVPVLGDLAEGLVFQITEIIPDLLTLYESASSAAYLDEIACDLFSLVCSECRYPTYTEVFEQYFNSSLAGMPNLANATLNEIAERLLELISNPASIAYNTIVVWELWIILSGAVFNGEKNGNKALTKYAALGEDVANDNWFDLCDGCQELYARVEYDYKTSDNNSYFVPGFFGTNQYTRIGGRGVIVQEGQNAASIGLPLDPTWVIRSIGVVMSKDVNPNYNSRELHLRPTPRSATGQTTLSSVNGFGGLGFCRENLLDISGFQEFALRVAPAAGSGVGYVEKIIIIYTMPNAPSGATPTDDTTICS